jgi:tritrans,polycis-undecaprenyl-diphosphate synthase [geranylgeranyl-diphosphate specific]
MENKNEVPRHIGIILDGNRRFAKKLVQKPWMGHEWGAKKVEKLFDWCREVGVREMTLYTFSMQNFNRPKEEFNHLMRIFSQVFSDAKNNEAVHKNRIRIRFLGRIHLFPSDVHAKMTELMEATKEYDSYTINFAMAYGGREEIVDAVKKIGRLIEEGKITDTEVSEELISKNLYNDSQPDLIIRTGGDHRTSNFLVWQSSYSEWFFLEKTWPEFEKDDLLQCIAEFQQRERRFGK